MRGGFLSTACRRCFLLLSCRQWGEPDGAAWELLHGAGLAGVGGGAGAGVALGAGGTHGACVALLALGTVLLLHLVGHSEAVEDRHVGPQELHDLVGLHLVELLLRLEVEREDRPEPGLHQALETLVVFRSLLVVLLLEPGLHVARELRGDRVESSAHEEAVGRVPAVREDDRDGGRGGRGLGDGRRAGGDHALHGRRVALLGAVRGGLAVRVGLADVAGGGVGVVGEHRDDAHHRDGGQDGRDAGVLAVAVRARLHGRYLHCNGNFGRRVASPLPPVCSDRPHHYGQPAGFANQKCIKLTFDPENLSVTFGKK